jgi:hypothetical protein
MIKPHLKFLLADPTGWLVKSLEITALAFCLVVGMYDPVFGQKLEISTYIEPDSLSVGDKFVFVNSVKSAEDLQYKPAPLSEQLGDAIVLSDIFKLPESSSGTEAYACTLAVYKSGEVEIPSFVFNFTDSLGDIQGEIGKTLRTTIHSVLPDDTTSIDIADIKEPIKLREPIWPYLAIAGGITMIVVLIYISRKYLRKETGVPVVPPRPPWEIAYEKLDGLKNEKHIEFGRLGKYYFELSLIIREYIEGRFGFPAAEYTTFELENAPDLKEIEDALYKRLFDLFYRADLAKFAKYMPTNESAESDMGFAYDFVSKTIPVVEEEKLVENKSEEAVETA